MEITLSILGHFSKSDKRSGRKTVIVGSLWGKGLCSNAKEDSVALLMLLLSLDRAAWCWWWEAWGLPACILPRPFCRGSLSSFTFPHFRGKPGIAEDEKALLAAHCTWGIFRRSDLYFRFFPLTLNKVLLRLEICKPTLMLFLRFWPRLSRSMRGL